MKGNLNEVVIVSFSRTPIGDFNGMLKDFSAVDLAKISINAMLNKAAVSPAMIEEVACGCVYKAGLKGNPARLIQIETGMPSDGWAYTTDQQCGSGVKAFESVFYSILLGKARAGVAVGMDSMSNTPYILKQARRGFRMGDGALIDTMLHDGLVCAMEGYHMGITAENLAKEYGISREEQDELALLSHERAVKAQKNHVFDEEIAGVEINKKGVVTSLTRDEHPKEDLTYEQLAKLKPAFSKDGTVTAGNASSINDAAASILLMSRQCAEDLGLKPLAKVVATASHGVEPGIMGIGPVPAVRKNLEYAGVSIEEIDYFEINEAFAAQFLAVNRELKLDMDKVNANGSGISLGHPVGCTGVRIIGAALNELRRRKGRYGLASLCVGGGPAMSVIIENIG